MILVAFVGSARAWRLVWREQLVWLSALLEQNSWRSAAAAAPSSDDARPGARRAARKRRRAAKSGPRTIANPEAGRTYSTRIAHEQMDAMAAKWKARGVKLVEANYKLQKLPGPNGVVYMSE